MDLASVVAALASVGVRVSGSTPNNNIQGDSSRACPTGLAGPEPSGTHNDPGQHFHNNNNNNNNTHIYIYIYIVIVIVITTYHAVYCSYRASRADSCFLPRSILWVPGLAEVAHSMTEDPEDRGYRSTRLWGQWQLQSVSISNGDRRWPFFSPGVWGRGTATQQHRNKQKARASLSGAKRQPRHKAARMRRSKSGLSVVRVPPPPWRRPVLVTPLNPLPVAYSQIPTTPDST